MTTKWILQRHENDCGVAAMAMLLGLGYRETNEAIRAIVREADKKFEGVDSDLFKQACTRLGYRGSSRDVSGRNRETLRRKLKGRPAIIVAPAKDRTEDWHALYWDGFRIYDPNGLHGTYKHAPAKALKSMHEVWFLENKPILPI